MSVLVLGAGFGGLELAASLSQEFGENADVVLVDKADGFVFGFSKLDVLFGRTDADHVMHPYRGLRLPGVEFVQATIEVIDPAARRVTTDKGVLSGDVLVVALGADVDVAATPGLAEGGHEFYSVPGAFAARDALHAFAGGRVVVAVTSTPFKCPPAPSETALLLHAMLRDRGLLESSTISLVMPFGLPIPPSPEASRALLDAFRERGISWMPDRLVRGVDADDNVVLTNADEQLPCDLLLAVPVHRAPAVVQQSGLAPGGWIPVDPMTLRTTFESVYAIGDVTSVGTPKAGVFAEGQAVVVAREIIARRRGRIPDLVYDGRGICYLEFGDHLVGKVDVTFMAGQAPAGALEGPSHDLARDKEAFGTSRIARWFDRDWTAVPG